ncbi:MAG: ribosome assembly factor SBDS [Nanoarchaeota archaeon]
MTEVEARLKIKGKNFEVLVDVDRAVQFKRGEGRIEEVLVVDDVFYDLKKGLKASDSDLNGAFGTSNSKEVAEKIIKRGEVCLPAEYRKKKQEDKIKQVIDFLARNAIDPTTSLPISEKRIQEAIEHSGINIENKPVEQQINKIVSKLKEIMPIKIEMKKLKITVPAEHTGKVYSLLQEYKEREDWLNNGDLSITISLPAGLEMDFYDKLNNVTHGSAVVEEIKEKGER